MNPGQWQELTKKTLLLGPVPQAAYDQGRVLTELRRQQNRERVKRQEPADRAAGRPQSLGRTGRGGFRSRGGAKQTSGQRASPHLHDSPCTREPPAAQTVQDRGIVHQGTLASVTEAGPDPGTNHPGHLVSHRASGPCQTLPQDGKLSTQLVLV